MSMGCNIWMICLQLNWLFYDLSRILQLSELYRRYVLLYKSFFNNFLFIGATDRNLNSSDQKQLFFAVIIKVVFFIKYNSFPVNSKCFVFYLDNFPPWCCQIVPSQKMVIVTVTYGTLIKSLDTVQYNSFGE